MRNSFLLASLIFLFSTADFAGEGEPCPGDAGGSTGGSVSTPPAGGGGGGTGGGSTMDQMGKSFDPKAGGGGGDPMKKLLKTESKGSKGLMDSKKNEQLSKLEKRMLADKATLHRVREQASEALRDLKRANDEVDEVGRDLLNAESTNEKQRLLGELRKATRELMRVEKRAEEREWEFKVSIDKFGESLDRYDQMKASRDAIPIEQVKLYPDAQSTPPPSK